MGKEITDKEIKKKGGRREGAGRKKAPHTIQTEAYRKALIEAVLKEKKPIIKALIKKAIGGDILAIKEVNDRVLGKATQPITGEEGETLFGELTTALKQLASRK